MSENKKMETKEYGIDKLNFWIPEGSWDITPQKLEDNFTKQVTKTPQGLTKRTEEDRIQVKHWYNGQKINIDITKDKSLVIGTNPSHLQEPKGWIRPKTFLTDNLAPYIDILTTEIEKSGIHVDNVLNLQPCRLDFATQTFLKHDFNSYNNVFDMLNGKRMKNKLNFGTSRTWGNKSHQIMVYDKSLESGLIDENLTRCEIRLLKSKDIKTHLANNLEGLVNLSSKNYKVFNNRFLDNKLFHGTNQIKMAFDENFNLIEQLKKEFPRDYLAALFMVKGAGKLLSEFGGVGHMEDFINEVIKDKSLKTKQRYIKKIERLLLYSYANPSKEDDTNLINLTQELKENFYLKIA